MKATNPRGADTPGLYLLLGILILAAIYLKNTTWMQNLEVAFFAVLAGFGLGFLLGKSRYDRSSSILLLIIYTLIFIPSAVLITLTADHPLFDNLFAIFHRGGVSIHQFYSGGEVSSSLMILLVFILLFWIISFLGAFLHIRRGGTYLPIVFAMASVVVIDYFLPEGQGNSWVAAAIAFIGLFYFITQFGMSQKRRGGSLREPGESGPTWTTQPFLFVITLILLVAAWSLPLGVRAASPGTPESQRFSRFSYRVRDNFERLTASLRGSARSLAIGYGPRMGLGSSASTGEEVIFSAEASQAQRDQPNLYWRSKVYEVYDGDAWQSGQQMQTSLAPNSILPIPLESESGAKITYRIKADTPLGDYFFPGALESINNPAILVYTPTGKDEKDIISLEPESTVLTGLGYRINVRFDPPDENALLSAQGPIPAWVSDRYLQLPKDISPRIKKLAEEITGGAGSDYEKTQAITNYLRSHYQYSVTPAFPEQVEDRLEWFLFEGREGYCNYFATAEVLLLRSIGIPARLAVGFAQGDLSGDGLHYTVRGKDRHAWAEVYFPGVGWVIFEPTPSQPPYEISKEESLLDSTEKPERTRIRGTAIPDPGDQAEAGNIAEISSGENSAGLSDLNEPGYNYFPAILLLFTVGVLIFYLAARRLERGQKIRIAQRVESINLPFSSNGKAMLQNLLKDWLKPEIERVYNELVGMGQFLYHAGLGNSTPAERVQEIIEACPVIQFEAEEILRDYEQYRFGGRDSDDRIARERGQRAIIAMIWYKIKTIFRIRGTRRGVD